MEFIGESVEQALEKAKQYYGTDNLEYEVVSEKRGLLRNEVVVRAWVVSPESVASQLLESILRSLGKTGSVHTEQVEDELHISIDGDDLGILIGKHGSFLDTLESFVRYIIRARFPEIAHVDVDVMSYKQKRISQLEEFVEETVQKVKKTRRPQTLPPMLRWERREIHRIVAEKYPTVESKSTGVDPNRRVQIFLKTAENAGDGRRQKDEQN